MRYKYKLSFISEKENFTGGKQKFFVLSVNECFEIFLNAKPLEDIRFQF